MKFDREMTDFYALVWHFDGSPRHGTRKYPGVPLPVSPAPRLFCPAGGDMGEKDANKLTRMRRGKVFPEIQEKKRIFD